MALHIPKSIADSVYLKPGVKIDMNVHEGNLIIHYSKSKLEHLLECITEDNIHKEALDDKDPKGKEIW